MNDSHRSVFDLKRINSKEKKERSVLFLIDCVAPMHESVLMFVSCMRMDQAGIHMCTTVLFVCHRDLSHLKNIELAQSSVPGSSSRYLGSHVICISYI